MVFNFMLYDDICVIMNVADRCPLGRFASARAEEAVGPSYKTHHYKLG